MAQEPGNLSDFRTIALREWDALLARYFGGNSSEQLLARPDERTPEVVPVEWGAYPVRVKDCLQSLPGSYRLLDWSTPQGDIGRAELQEEYFEWRVVRDASGKIRRVEMTTEFPEYWEVLAAHHPVEVLRLVARFAGEPSVPPEAVYGSVDLFGLGVSPEERRAAFRDAMLPNEGNAPWSPYNNGQKAICFMSQGANTLGALIHLVVAAAFPYGAQDPETGQLRKLSGPEAIATGTQAAVPCRNSDPTVVGATIGLAWDGRLFALDDPIGVYIRSVQNEQLLQPDGSPVPLEWFDFQRGSRPHGPEGLERSQRLVFEVPPGLGFSVGDLTDSGTNQKIEFGGQIADLVQIAVYARIGERDAVQIQPREVPLPDLVACEEDPGCRSVVELNRSFEEAQRNLLANTPTGILDRSGGPVS